MESYGYIVSSVCHRTLHISSRHSIPIHLVHCSKVTHLTLPASITSSIMVQCSCLAAIAAVASLFFLTTAHPGEHHDHEHVRREIQQRDHLSSRAARSLSQCAGSTKARSLKERATNRRAITAERLRKERGIQAGHCECKQTTLQYT